MIIKILTKWKQKHFKKKTITIAELSRRRPLVLSNSTPESMKYGISKRAREFNNAEQQLKQLRKFDGSETVYDKTEETIEDFTLSMINQIAGRYQNTQAVLDYDEQLFSLYKELNTLLNSYLPEEKRMTFHYQRGTSYKDKVDFNNGDRHKNTVSSFVYFLKNNREVINKTILMYDYILEYMEDANKRMCSLNNVEEV